MHSRREFCRTVSLFTLAAALPRPVFGQSKPADEPKLNFRKQTVRGGGFVLGSLTDGGNVLIMPSELGPIMIDAKHSHTAADLQSDIKLLLMASPAVLINTHHHADHSGGNWLFSDTAKIVAHKNFNPRISANVERYVNDAEASVERINRSDADQAMIKAVTERAAKIKSLKAEHFSAKQELADGVTVIDHGGVVMQIVHVGHGHTDNDLMIFFPKHNVLHVGDLLFNNLHPFIDRSAKANTLKWQDSLRKAIAMTDAETVIIPGHGELADNGALNRQIKYFDTLRAVVMNAMREGKSRETIAGMKPDEFKTVGFEQLQSRALGAMYEELAEEMH